ncbi:histidine kinase [soil metagenome]
MVKYTNRKNIPLLIHIFGWVLFGAVIFFLSPLSAGVDRPGEYWIKQWMMLALLVGAFYLNFLYLIPKVLFSNKPLMFLGINLLGALIYVGFSMFYDEYYNMPELMHRTIRPDVPFTSRGPNYYFYFNHLFTYLMAIGICTSVAAVMKWQSDEKTRLELDQQRMKSELGYLKAQINPHFFFNTLNNIYSLTNLDVEKAQLAILKLSRMMRYVLYETENDSSLLSKELDFIKDFIELMRLRLSEKVKVQVEIPQQFKDAPLAPMLLLPFIENSFKHGISSLKPSSIYIKICVNDRHLRMQIVNSIFQSTPNPPEGSASGIGLANTKRRLALLYRQKHELVIDDQNPENEFRVDLKIDLK